MPLNTSQFPASTNPPNTTDLLPIMQGGRMKQTTLGALFTQLAAFLQSGTAPNTRTTQDKERDIIAVPDHAAIANSLSAASARALYHPGVATKTLTAQADIPANTLVYGNGPGSLIQTLTTSLHLLSAAVASARVRDLKLSGANGSSVTNNSGVVFTSASYGDIQSCELTGMSGMAVYVTGSSYIRALFNYVHGLSGSYTNSCDIGFYTDASYGLAFANYLSGGTSTEVGVLMQLNSIKHKIIANYIGAHTTYGATEYENTPKHTYNLFAMNTVEDIDGATLSGTSGAGFYGVATGQSIIGLNHFRNTNINTTTETLAPGAIGISQSFSPMLAIGNMITLAKWYGAIVVSSTSAVVDLLGNSFFECALGAVYVKSSSHVNIVGGSVTQLTATPLTARAIAVNVAGGGPFTGVSVIGQRIRGGLRGIELSATGNFAICNNNISECNGAAIRLAGGTLVGGTVSGNVGDSTASATQPALDVSGAQSVTYTGNVLNSQSTTCVSFAGTNTGSVFDETNIVSVSGVIGGMNNINNTSAGCRVTQYGAGAPTSLNHQVGDRVINSAPGVGLAEYWDCTVAGLPGTWVPMNIMAGVSADRGNAGQTLTASVDAPTQVWNTAITADRAVTLSTSGVWNGAKFRIVRTANATGAFNLNVGAGPLKAMGTAGSYADVEYNGNTAAWMLTGYGVL